MPAITRLVAVAGKARVRVHLDGAYWQTLPLSLVVEEDLRIGLEVDVARLDTRRVEAEALAYKGNPVDSLAPLAKAGVPWRAGREGRG